jgi:hypothetical protein
MKNLELAEYDVIQLETKDAQEIVGGWWQIFVGFVLTQALVNPQAHIKALVQGIEEGYNATANQE